MANYLPVYKQIWTSTKFNKLNPNEKLIFLYLLTSPTSQNTGIFHILEKEISCYCDIDIKVVNESLKTLKEIGLIKYWKNENLVYICKMFKFTRGTIKNKGILYATTLRQEQLIQNHEVWQYFKEDNLEFYEDLKKFEQEQNKDIINEANLYDDS